MSLDVFGPATRAWFEATFPSPTRVQQEGWPPIARGEHALLLAPTGSGKTLAAFLACIDRLAALPADAEPGVRILYVSPLKALVYDIERNLRAPLIGIAHTAARLGLPHRPIRVDVRTGDTPARDRRQQAKDPAEILVTTPESLYLLLTSEARQTLRTVQTVLVDEIHTLAGTKRGVHLALSLERLEAGCEGAPQRVGLSATQRPLQAIAGFLAGERPVTLVDTSEPPDLDLRIVVPVADMERPTLPQAPELSGGEGQRQQVGGASEEEGWEDEGGWEEELGAGPPAGPTGRQVAHGLWPTIYPELLALIRAHRSTIVFVNSRLLCERLAQRLNELAGEELVRAHHGSLSHHQRQVIEEQLKAGSLPGLVATSSLELGIDMGAVDLVVLVESPGSVARGLQRVGRAGHGVGQRSIGRIFPKHRADLVESAVVAREMLAGRIEATSVPRTCLDVLAQHIVAMVAVEDLDVEALLATVRRAGPYRGLTRQVLDNVLDMLAGRYPSDDFADLSPRLVWDRTADRLSARKGARQLALLNAGTIPDRGLYAVYLAGDGPRIGELDEEMVYETRKGDLVILGASTWRVEEVTRDRVVVSPAPGEPGRLPFWHGERPGRPVDLGRAVGALLREVARRGGEEARGWLEAETQLEGHAVGNLAAYVQEQREATGEVPSDRMVVVESFRDELGDWRVCILTPFGSRVHAPWALAIEALLSARAGVGVQSLWTDDGIALRFPDIETLPPLDQVLPDPEEVRELVVEQLRWSALFASRFRENAARALLLPRRRFKGRTPLWAQRLRSQDLLNVASRFPSFPIVLETYRECLQDVFDLPALEEVLGAIRSRRIAVHEVETPRASPFARSLVFAWVAAFMYEGDAPLAERKAQALTLDRELLRELLGEEELRELLDPGAVAEVEAELQWLTETRRARHADAVHDLLRRLGELTDEEVAARAEAEAEAEAWLQALALARRALLVRVGGRAVWIAAEDAGRYRDALGVVLPPGLPAAFVEPVPDALESLLLRYARTHGPFLSQEVADRWGLPVGAVAAGLAALEAREQVARGGMRPGGTQEEWCHPDVLRRLRRRSLAALRKEVAPVEPEVYARFLLDWHGVGARRGGIGRVQEVLDQLEGLPLPFSALVDTILPARVPGFSADLLDQLGAMGALAWVGHGALGARDGRVALYRRERVSLLLEPPEPPEALLHDPDDPDAPLRAAVFAHLGGRGACFLVELQTATGAGLSELTRALWDLVWAGLVTNDTLGPLRALRGRRRDRGAARVAGGRWSLVRSLMGPAGVTPTERAHARALLLMERYGVASPAAASADGLVGGFSSVYPVLREMEEAGRARRGWFVEEQGGAQFALPGAVDRLRAHREPEGGGVVLAAVDPANPWGAVLPWPAREEGPRPRRVAGASVVLVGGQPVLYVEAGGRGVITLQAADDPVLLRQALDALREGARRWRIDRIDGSPALDAPLAEAFVEAGFARGYKSLEL